MYKCNNLFLPINIKVQINKTYDIQIINMEIYRFLVVEFDGGLQIIPSNWLINDKSSFFPNYKNFKLYDRAVVSTEIPNTPTTTWDVYNIKKIFEKTGLICLF